jgi:hypothetical protein
MPRLARAWSMTWRVANSSGRVGTWMPVGMAVCSRASMSMIAARSPSSTGFAPVSPRPTATGHRAWGEVPPQAATAAVTEPHLRRAVDEVMAPAAVADLVAIALDKAISK